MSRNIHVIINPGSGQPQPILHTLNQVFREAEVGWDISLTKQSGDAERFARQAVADGVDVVAAYGGDGTVMEVARGLISTSTPLAILPGGTANLMSVELGIPKDLAKAARIASSAESVTRPVDMGKVGDTFFLLRVGIGFAARKVELTDRKLKDKYGIMAYSIGALKAITQVKATRYHITLDGKEFNIKGLTCLVDNAGNLGMAGISAAKDISVSDGLLDIILIEKASFGAWVDISELLVNRTPVKEGYFHAQAKHIQIETDPVETIQVDGEIAGNTPLTIQVVPQAVFVLTSA